MSKWRDDENKPFRGSRTKQPTVFRQTFFRISSVPIDRNTPKKSAKFLRDARKTSCARKNGRFFFFPGNQSGPRHPMRMAGSIGNPRRECFKSWSNPVRKKMGSRRSRFVKKWLKMSAPFPGTARFFGAIDKSRNGREKFKPSQRRECSSRSATPAASMGLTRQMV
jgi:hypothetical protein